MAKLAYAPDLGSGGAIRAGSTPVTRTSGEPRGQFRVSVFLGRELFSAHEIHLFRIDNTFNSPIIRFFLKELFRWTKLHL